MSEWHQKNREHISKKRKHYYLMNKERINAYQNQYNLVKAHCEMCDCEFRKCYKSAHNNSKKHKDRLAFRALKNKAPIFNMFSNIKYVRACQDKSTKD